MAQEDECFPWVLIFGGSLMAPSCHLCQSCPDVFEDRSRGGMSCLLLLNRGLRNARFVWPSAGWKPGSLPTVLFLQSEIPKQLLSQHHADICLSCLWIHFQGLSLYLVERNRVKWVYTIMSRLKVSVYFKERTLYFEVITYSKQVF